jgi:uncharacterized protein (DUF433 family)
MSDKTATYVTETADGGWRVAGTRVSLDSIVHLYLDGRSPEAIADSFPTLSLEQIHGAIAYYLRDRDRIDKHLAQQDSRWSELATASDAAHEPLLNRLRAARQETGKES